jgi:hypothetical protein
MSVTSPLSIAIPLDKEADLSGVASACLLARATGARLEIVCGVPRPFPLAALVTDIERLEQEVAEGQQRLLRRALALVPPDVLVTHRSVSGRACRHVAKQRGSAESNQEG